MSRVLLIIDNESIMDRTAGMLEDMGWAVDIANSRKAALWTCISRRPSLAVVDIETRGGAGLEMISTIRRIDKKLFILAVTRGSQDDTLRRLAEVCGANHLVSGPFRKRNSSRQSKTAGPAASSRPGRSSSIPRNRKLAHDRHRDSIANP